jgi:hypothetical protein
VFEAAEAAAKRTGVSRSQFFVNAVKLFLKAHGDRGVTERLDEVYGKSESKVDPALSTMQWLTTRSRDAW